jgi:hypothetical protein
MKQKSNLIYFIVGLLIIKKYCCHFFPLYIIFTIKLQVFHSNFNLIYGKFGQLLLANTQPVKHEYVSAYVKVAQ